MWQVCSLYGFNLFQLFIVEQGFDIQQDLDLLTNLAHAGDIVLTIATGGRWWFNFVGRDGDDLTDLIDHQTHGVFIDIDDNDTGALIVIAVGQAEAPTYIDNRNDLAAQIQHPDDMIGQIGHRSDRLNPDNLDDMANFNTITF